MTNWSEDYAHVNGIRIHYTRTGDGSKPALVLLHGFSDSGLCWSRIARALEADYDVVMPDARGHGLSSGPEHGFSASLMVADTAMLIQELDLQKPRLLGHSMGAGTALRVAASYPTLLHSIALEDPALRVDAAKEPPTSEEMHKRWQWIFDLKALTRDELLVTAHKHNPNWSEEEIIPWADSKLQFNIGVLDARAESNSILLTDPYEALQSITCPILLLTGDPELHAIITPEAAEKAARVWHDGRLVHIAGAGHNIRRDQYEPFITAVKAFFKEK